jgi:hypothetical protein
MNEWTKGAKQVCIIGSVLAVLFPPLKVLGMSAGWGFLFGTAGMGMMNYQFIDVTSLLLELILINGVGIALYFIGLNKLSAPAQPSCTVAPGQATLSEPVASTQIHPTTVCGSCGVENFASAKICKACWKPLMS